MSAVTDSGVEGTVCPGPMVGLSGGGDLQGVESAAVASR